MALGAQRERGSRRDALVQRHLGEHRIFAVIDIIHDAADHEPLGDRIAQLANRHALGQVPFEAVRKAGFARIEPIAVPAFIRLHTDRDGEALARCRGQRLGEKIGLDRVFTRGLRGRNDRQQQQKGHNCANKRPKSRKSHLFAPSRARYSSAISAVHYQGVYR